MITDPSVLAAVISATLLTGVAVGTMLAGLAHRGRAEEDLDRAERAIRDLLAVAEACADPVHRPRLRRSAAQIWDNLRPGGFALEFAAPPPRSPEYVHRLISAYATGDPLDFDGCPVPPDVQGRIRAIMAGAAEPTARIPQYATGGPVTALTPPLAGDALLIRPRSSDG